MNYTGTQVNDVLRVVASMSPSADTQLSILAHALVVACKSCEVPSESAIARVEELFLTDMELEPLQTVRN